MDPRGSHVKRRSQADEEAGVVDFNVAKAQWLDRVAIQLALLEPGATPKRTLELAQSLWRRLGHLAPAEAVHTYLRGTRQEAAAIPRDFARWVPSAQTDAVDPPMPLENSRQ